VNTALSTEELSDGHYLRDRILRDAANPYRPFLTKHHGSDLWQSRGEIDLLEDFTRKGNTWNAGVALSIIDRTAIGPEVPGGSITTVDRIIDPTLDHRPIPSHFAIPVVTTSHGRINQEGLA